MVGGAGRIRFRSRRLGAIVVGGATMSLGCGPCGIMAEQELPTYLTYPRQELESTLGSFASKEFGGGVG